MGVLTIRNVDDEVIAALKARARANHRSLEGELRHLLSRFATPDSNLGLYKYGNHLTPGLAEVSFYAAVLTSFLAAGFRVRRFRGIPALKTS